MGCRGSIWQADGAWSDELSFSLWWMRSFSYGHAFPMGFYMATSFNEASGDVMGLLFFCPSFFLSLLPHCSRGSVRYIDHPMRPAEACLDHCGQMPVRKVSGGAGGKWPLATSRPSDI